MALYSRVGRPKPQSGGFELAAWYLMRVSGVALFVLALTHFSLQHFVFDPANQTSTWIFEQRWNSIFWRTFDWLLLSMVLFHSFMGMRTVAKDYLKGGKRTLALSALYLVWLVLWLAGTAVVLSFKMPGA